MDMIVGRGTRYAALVLRTTSGFAPKITSTHARCLCRCDSRRQNVNAYDASNSWRIGQCSSYSISSRLVIQNLFRPNGGIKARLSSTAPQRSDKERSPSLQCNKESSGPQQSNQKSSAPQQSKEDICEPILPEKQTIFQKMKQLTKDYWHILIPVHVVTSIGWASMFYAAAKNGVDIVSIMEYLNLGERYLDLMRGSNAGHWAVTYALYKLATPVRYTVTVGGTTMSIRYLNKMGYLKFKPRSTMKEMQSSKCAAEPRESRAKAAFKDQQQTEPPKT